MLARLSTKIACSLLAREYNGGAGAGEKSHDAPAHCRELCHRALTLRGRAGLAEVRPQGGFHGTTPRLFRTSDFFRNSNRERCSVRQKGENRWTQWKLSERQGLC